ncbi:reverse transcriptase [Cucumis melo var. makuwa]|uniref:Reverse transcriptase n=1 Tax=Cucumis melo var. makuwa TaxID=1194695 RepID=A0A5D3C0D0_CUCMM|nr:reverse transcriptase [Cucumis melo var. makuwa]TYK04632.1 reverse transcriptase [Cucumis melo var. makuwa]
MVSERINNETLEKILGISRTKTAVVVVVDTTMEKLLQRIQTPSIYPMGQPSPPFVQPSGQKRLYASPLPGVWAHTPSSINLTAYPIRYYAPSLVQPSHPFGHLPPYALRIVAGQQPSKLETVSTSQPISPTTSQTSSLTLSVIAQSGHLKGFSEHFVSYTPCVGNEKIRIVDDSLAPIAGKGQIVLFDGFSLHNVLHVPKLYYNLLSISKITRELHCKATFLPEFVCFQALNLERMIAARLINRMPSRILYLQTPLECLKESYPSTRLVLEGESVSKESNNTFEFIEPTPSTVSDIDPHPIILPTDQVPGKTYYRRNLKKEVGSPISQPPAPIQDSKPPRDQGMENPTEPCTNNMMNENDMSDVAVLENVEEKNNGKLDKYDPSLDLPIALRKGTRSCTKHFISNYVSYENLSPQFRAFTASLDSTTMPKNIHIALECPEWKNVVMEEMKALKKNNTWEICALPKGYKHVGCKGCSLSNTKQMEHLTDTRQGKIAVLIVYVDDIVLSGDDQAEISQLKQRMSNEFEIKDLGNLKYFLGMKVTRSKEGISVSQRKYTLGLLAETSMFGCRPAQWRI